jgi:YidC/Oxa1 family membrane protein insertase
VVSIFNNIADAMGAVLAFLYKVIPSYGLAIIGLTVLVRLVLFPLTAKQARSMQKMQLVQPEIKKLQAKYKDNRQQLNEEIMKFYKENQINPMAGCLPLVFQMPVFFALYRVLRSPLSHIPQDSKLFHAFCGDASAKNCHAKGLKFLGLDLSKSAADIHNGFATALPYFLLIALVVITGYVQFKQTQSRQTSAQQANPQAAMMGKIFPALFAFISYRLPSGVVLYFLVSNAWQIGQQAVIFQTAPEPIVGGAGGGAIPASGSAPRVAGNKPDGRPGGGGKAKADEPAPAPEGRFKRALGQARDAAGNKGRPVAGSGGNGDGQGSTGAKRPPASGGSRPAGAAGAGDGGHGRAQPSGSQPRPKKRRR